MSDPEGITLTLPARPSIWATTDTGTAIRLDTADDGSPAVRNLDNRDLAITEAIVRLALARIEAEQNRRAWGIQFPAAASASTTDGGL